MNDVAAYLFEHDLHHLDHLAPFCALCNYPLYTTQISIADRAQEQYPKLNIHYFPYEESIGHLVQHYRVIISCLPTPLLEPLFFFEEYLRQKKLLFFWLSHGYSDKEVYEGLHKERFLFLYGDNMKKRLEEQKLLEQTYKTFTIGNFRKLYYEQNKPFYDNNLLLPLTFPKKQKTVLFAPTWDNLDIFDELNELLRLWDPHYNLLIKLHPNTVLKYPELLDTVKKEQKENHYIKFVEDTSTIYPLLQQTDILLTDHSSVAYDFLAFDRPIIFYKNRTKYPIHECGITIRSGKELASALLSKDTHASIRKETYKKTFAATKDFSKLPHEIDATVKQYLETEPHFLT